MAGWDEAFCWVLLQPVGRVVNLRTNHHASFSEPAPFSVTFTPARIRPERSVIGIEQGGFEASGVPLEVSKPISAHFYIIQKPKQTFRIFALGVLSASASRGHRLAILRSTTKRYMHYSTAQHSTAQYSTVHTVWTIPDRKAGSTWSCNHAQADTNSTTHRPTGLGNKTCFNVFVGHWGVQPSVTARQTGPAKDEKFLSHRTENNPACFCCRASGRPHLPPLGYLTHDQQEKVVWGRLRCRKKKGKKKKVGAGVALLCCQSEHTVVAVESSAGGTG